MSSRAPILLAGTLLVAAVAVTAIFWSGSRAGVAPSASEALAEASARPVGFGGAVDLARSPIPLDRQELIPMTVYLSPTCGCCSGWVAHAQEHGFEIDLQYRVDMTQVKEEHGVRPELSSCHTAVVNGYVVEGHVPGDVVRRFLAEAPAVAGLAVPGMPVGSPGMEMGDVVDPYDVLTFTSDGRTQVYSSQGRS